MSSTPPSTYSALSGTEMMHTFDYVIHRVGQEGTGVLVVCANCYEVRFLYGPDREHDYSILNHSELEPCTEGAVYLTRGQRL